MLAHLIAILLKRRPVAAAAGPVLVQNSGVQSIQNSANASDTLNAASNFTAGNNVYIGFAHYSGANNATAGITVSGTAAAMVSRVNSTTNTKYWVEIWKAENIAGGSTAVVVTWANPGESSYFSGGWVEVSGMAGGNTTDQVPTGLDNSNGGTGTTRTITSGVTTVAREVVIAAAVEVVFSDALAGPTSGFTTISAFNGVPGDLDNAIGFKIISATGAQSATFTNTASNEVCCVLATFKGT